MKRLLAVMVILAMLCGCAWADVFTVDTETATVEEIEAVIEALQKALKEKKGETVPETYVFSNGSTMAIAGVDKNGGAVTVHYLYSHQKDTPQSLFGCFCTQVYQNGIELSRFDGYIENDYRTYSTNILKGALFEVTQTYTLFDDSPITIIVRPWSAWTEVYTVTVDIE